MITHANLDKRICDCEKCENTQTYREYIRESEKELGIEQSNLDSLSDEELQSNLDFLDYLWEK